MIKEAIDRLLALAPPNIHEVGELEYSDKTLNLIYPPQAKPVECSTLQGLADLVHASLDSVDAKEVLLHVTSPTSVELISIHSDDHGRRRVWVEANHPLCKSFPFGSWLDPEAFIISAQMQFQRAKVQNDDGSFAPDLDYVLKIASNISADHTTDNVDDGFTQRVAVKQGVTLKAEAILKPIVNLAPYRTFAEIDQVLSAFVFRARVQNGSAHLALFEGDGGRWTLGAIAAIKAYLVAACPEVKVIS